MDRDPPDHTSRIIGTVAFAFGLIALLLACVGVGTPAWISIYTADGSGGYYRSGTANFFYTCVFYSNGTLQNCTNRGSSLYGYPSYSTANPWMTDYNQRMQNAAGLTIVGILFIFFGTVATLVMSILYLHTWFNIIPPALLFLACLFMLAGMAEGSRYLLYNDYSANLYQTAHLFTMFSLFLCSFAAGRINFSRWTKV